MSYADPVQNIRAMSRLSLSTVCILKIATALLLCIATSMVHGDERTLRVSIDAGFPPFEYIDETGKPSGFVVDIINQLASDQKFSVEYTPATPISAKAMLGKGTIDMQAIMYSDINPSYAATVSTPLCYTSYSVVVRVGSDIHDNTDIRNHSIATRMGDLAQTAGSIPGSRIIAFDDWTAMLTSVINGSADCAIVPTIIGSRLLLEQSMRTLTMIGPALWHTTYRLAFHTGDIALSNLVDSGLAMMRDSGTMDRISVRWLSIQKAPSTSAISGAVLAILAATLTIAAVAVAWALVLRKRLANITTVAIPMPQADSSPMVHPHEANDQADEPKQHEDDMSTENTKLIACLSRELRTPLLGVSGALEMLKPAHLAPEDHQTLEMAMSSLRQLGRIMDTLDDVVDAKNGSMHVQMSEFQYAEFAQTIESQIRQAAEVRGLTFRCTIQGSNQYIVSDSERITQIIRNLCDNSIQFTEHGEIDLVLALMSDALHIVVRDTGPGLPEDVRHELFMPRYKDEQGNPAAKLGLGLALAKAIVDALRGSIGYTSKPNHGTEFEVIIPVLAGSKPIPAETQALMETPPVHSHHGRAIIAEDEAINRLYLKRVLELSGYQVAQAPNGAIALETALQDSWDFILMDVSMPRMDGLEATRRIRAHEIGRQGQRTPIIALTAHAYTEDRQACAQAGMDGFLSKPFTETALWTEIHRVLASLQPAPHPQ